MKIKLLVAAAATVLASSAMAQSAFEGFYGQLGVGYENNSLSSRTLNVTTRPGEPDSGTAGAKVSAPTSSGGGFAGVIGLGYNVSVAPSFLVGIGADYAPTSVTTSTQNSISCSSGCNLTNNYKISNRYNVFIAPGYELDKGKLVYIKGGFSSETVKWQSQAGWGGASTISQNANGYVVGLGYKQLIDKNIYVFGEGNYYSYSSNSVSGSSGSQTATQNQTPSAYQFLVGAGYKF